MWTLRILRAVWRENGAVNVVSLALWRQPWRQPPAAPKWWIEKALSGEKWKIEGIVDAEHHIFVLARESTRTVEETDCWNTCLQNMERTRTSGIALRPNPPQKRAAVTAARKEGKKRRRCTTSTSNSLNLQVVPECEMELTGVRPLVTQLTVPEEHHSFGLFVFLPTELCHMIFLLLDRAALGHLALTSTQMCSLVQSYVYTRAKVLPPSPSSFQDEVDPQNFAELGKCLSQYNNYVLRLCLVPRPSHLQFLIACSTIMYYNPVSSSRIFCTFRHWVI